MVAKNKPNELKIIRVFDAPVKAVWDAWTDPEQVAQWWGPRGFTITTHSKELRPGGVWHYTMHGPDGVDYPNKTLYFEVEKYAKLVYDHGGYDERKPLFRVTVLFSESKGKTTMDMTMAVSSPEALAEIKEIIKKASGNSTWDRLAEFVEEKQNGNEIFVINRSFDVPHKTMVEMWTNPEHIAQWLPPTGFQMKFIEVEIKSGGRSFYKMFNDAGVTMFGRINYLEIDKVTGRLVYTQEFCDEKGNLSRHPHAPTWPATMLTTIELTPEGTDSTRVTVRWQPHGKFTQEELATFLSARPGMTGGWTGSFDKLDAYLTK